MSPGSEALPPDQFRDLLEKRAPAFGLSLSDPALVRLSRFLGELDVARRRTNLTGPMPSSELVDHALESVLGERLIVQNAVVIDIGSGAGFPGVPLAAAREDLRVTPVEPRKKRMEFLRQVSVAVPLPNVMLAKPSIRQLPDCKADVVTVRAVGSVERILGDAPFLKSDGLLLAWTTDAKDLGRRLGHFSLENELPVPESRSKVIASFRKNVPRGTRIGVDSS